MCRQQNDKGSILLKQSSETESPEIILVRVDMWSPASLRTEPQSKMFWGFRSRCEIFRSWRNWRAQAFSKDTQKSTMRTTLTTQPSLNHEVLKSYTRRYRMWCSTEKVCQIIQQKFWSESPICCRKRWATFSGKILRLRINWDRSPPEHHSKIK